MVLPRLLLHAPAVQRDPEAAEALLPVVYEQLRATAGSFFRRERSDHTLQPTALVHEAWMKLEGHLDRFEDRKHFFRTAARAIRQVFANYVEAAQAKKRRGEQVQLTSLVDASAGPTEFFDALAVKEALDKLEGLNDRHARVVEMRFLCALTIDQTAEALGVSHGTVESDWAMARAWLQRELMSA